MKKSNSSSEYQLPPFDLLKDYDDINKDGIVSLRSIISSEKFQNSVMDLPIALGKSKSGEMIIADLAKLPHLLMVGGAGQGRFVALNAVLLSLLYKKKPSEIKFILIDTKLSLPSFNKIEKHFIAKLKDTESSVITDTKTAMRAINAMLLEMDNRYDLLKEARTRNIKEYNQKFTSNLLNPIDGHKFLPYLVLVIDEYADLVMNIGKEVETPISKLAQLSRAVGIHLIIATQRFTTDIFTKMLMANIPALMAFRVPSNEDSHIIDVKGAEQLNGRGDMLFVSGNDTIRLQGAFVDVPEEVNKVCDFIGSQENDVNSYTLP